MMCEHALDIMQCFEDEPSTPPPLLTLSVEQLLSQVGFSVDQLAVLVKTFLWEAEFNVISTLSLFKYVFAWFEPDARQHIGDWLNSQPLLIVPNYRRPYPSPHVWHGGLGQTRPIPLQLRRPPGKHGRPFVGLENRHRPHRLSDKEFAYVCRVLKTFPPDELGRLFLPHFIVRTPTCCKDGGKHRTYRQILHHTFPGDDGKDHTVDRCIAGFDLIQIDPQSECWMYRAQEPIEGCPIPKRAKNYGILPPKSS